MELEVVRDTPTEHSTIGRFIIDSKYHCNTLEDCIRIGPKVSGATAIPYGRYKVIIDYSSRFKKLMPHILDVPEFEGVRIHKGNTDLQTEGCVLLGMSRGVDKIWDCESAFHPFFDQLLTALAKGEEAWITIKSLEVRQ